MKKPFFLIALLLLSLPAMSQTYLGASLGSGEIDEEAVDDHAATWQLYGGYRFNDYLSVELSYLQVGSLDYDDGQLAC